MKRGQLRVTRRLDRIDISGNLVSGPAHRLFAAIHGGIEAGFDELRLDFADCAGAWPGPMLQLVAQAMAYRFAGKYTWLDLPRDQRLARLFRNANWAHLIDPRTYDESQFESLSQFPAAQYRTPSDQHAAVNRVVQAALSFAKDCDRSEIRAFEWALNEVTDNVLVHASSPIGGLVQMSYFPHRRHLMFVVADAGATIPGTLRDAFPDIASDAEAIDRALREGVTRDKALGQGNGLFGTFQICQKGAGTFVVDSRYAYALYQPNRGLHIRDQQVKYSGTLVSAELDFSVPGLLEDALRISGAVRQPADFIDTFYLDLTSEDLHFKVALEARSLGSRAAGEPLRRRLENISRMTDGKRVILDFADVALVSSSFADEVVAKLFVLLGPLEFMQRFEIRNANKLVTDLIDKAIRQRATAGSPFS
jgi:anti-sigma regulatory factor (Ser/Thr protein kinase)